LADLLPKFEDFFMLVTSAYNTLIDTDLRAEYDAEAASVQVDDPKTADTGYLARQNFLRGRALAAQRKYTEAVTFLENAVSLDPGQADFHLELGLVLSRNPRHREEAERRLLQAIELAPATVGAYVALAQMYLKTGKLGRAGRMAREALRWEPGHLEAGRILGEAGDAPDEPDELRQGAFRSS
jgi:Flp pilus assembly protein TadD